MVRKEPGHKRKGDEDGTWEEASTAKRDPLRGKSRSKVKGMPELAHVAPQGEQMRPQSLIHVQLHHSTGTAAAA